MDAETMAELPDPNADTGNNPVGFCFCPLDRDE
jgi:hypothetical protein